MQITADQYSLLQSAGRAACEARAKVYDVRLSQLALQEGFTDVNEMIEWQATIIAYGKELKPNAGLFVS
jgi:hypothetical protein